MNLPTKARLVDPIATERLAQKTAEAKAKLERDRFWERVTRWQNLMMREKARAEVTRITYRIEPSAGGTHGF